MADRDIKTGYGVTSARMSSRAEQSIARWLDGYLVTRLTTQKTPPYPPSLPKSSTLAVQPRAGTVSAEQRRC